MSCSKHAGLPIEEISDCEACLKLAGLWSEGSYTDLDQHDEQHDLGVCGKPDPE